MTYYVLAACAALAAFLALNASGSLVAAILWLGLRRRARLWSSAARSRALFWLCILPPAGALIFVAALLLPAYLKHEPYPTPEAVGLPLLALAICSAFFITLAVYRAAASWLATRRLMTFWMGRAEPVSVEGVAVPAYRLRDSTPVLAVVGTLRPRLFISGQVMDSLSSEELEVALAHERGHLLAHDTLRRAVVHFCRDLLPFFGAGRVLARAWAAEAETAADEYAARSGATGALALAAALIKIARLMPAGGEHVAPAGAFLLEGADDGVAGRVRRLTEMAPAWCVPSGGGFRTSKAALLTGLACLAVASALLAIDRQLLAAVHDLTERLIKLLA